MGHAFASWTRTVSHVQPPPATHGRRAFVAVSALLAVGCGSSAAPSAPIDTASFHAADTWAVSTDAARTDAAADAGRVPSDGAAISRDASADGAASPTTTFVPFQYLDPNIAQRPDVAGKSAKLTRVLKTPPLADIATVKLQDVNISLFAEVHDYFSRIDQKAAPVKPWKDPAPSCPAHTKLDSTALPTANGSLLCALVKQNAKQALSDPGRSCSEIATPESFAEDFDGEVDIGDVTGLENLIRTGLRPLYEVRDYPKTMRDGAVRSRIRKIILRVRYQTLSKTAEQQLTRYDGLLKDLKQSPNCFDFSATNANRAIKTVTELRDELKQQQKHLEQTYQSGLAQAKSDRAAVAAAQRTRPALPFPALTDADRQYLSMMLGGLYWRIRGRGLYEKPGGSTHLTRLYYNAMPMQALGELSGANDGKQAGFNIFLHIFKGWGEWFDMGTNPDQDDKYHDLALMTERGEYQIALARDQLDKAGYDATDLEIGGLQMGPCYYLIWQTQLKKIRIGLDLQHPFVHFLNSPTSWGELCAGAAISLGLSKTLLKGKSP